MPIREVAYYEAWCDHPGEVHRIDLGEFTAYSTASHVEDMLYEVDAVIHHVTGETYCDAHKPPTLCPDSDTSAHDWDPDEADPALISCLDCGAEKAHVESLATP